MILRLKALEETRSFYKVELGREDLTERERDKYSRALLRERRSPGEKRINILLSMVIETG